MSPLRRALGIAAYTYGEIHCNNEKTSEVSPSELLENCYE